MPLVHLGEALKEGHPEERFSATKDLCIPVAEPRKIQRSFVGLTPSSG